MPALLFWQQAFLAHVTGIIASRYLVGGLVCAMLLLVTAGPPYLRSRRVPLLLLCACIPAGYALGTSTKALDYYDIQSSLPEWFQPAKAVRFSGEVVHISGQPDRRLRILLQNVRPLSEGQADYNTPINQDQLSFSDALPGLVNFSWDQGSEPDGPRPLVGQTVTVTAKLMPVTGFANQGSPNSTAYWAARDVRFNAWTASGKVLETSNLEISGTPSHFAMAREKLRQSLVSALGGSAISTDMRRFARQQDAGKTANLSMTQASAILPALLFGDRYGLDTATLDLFVRANLVHSLALSGQHLALAALTAALLVWLVGVASRGALFLFIPRRTLTLCLSMPLALLYLWMGNAPLSLIRASLMMGFALLLLLAKRPSTLLDVLFMATTSMVLVWPQAVFDLSVQLSVLSVAGIALAAPLLNRVRKLPSSNIVTHTLKGMLLLLLTSTAVQIATLPIVLSTFGRVSPLFPLNLLWLPLLEFLVLPLTALGTLLLWIFGQHAFSDALFQLAALPAQGIIDLLTFLREHDWLPVWQGLKPTSMSAAAYGATVVAAAMALGAALRPKRSETVPMAAFCKHKPYRSHITLALCAALLLPVDAVERELSAFFAARDKTVILRMLDVGQGQALVLEWATEQGQQRLLLDGGGSTSPRFDPGRDVVAHALTANRPPRLKMMMASHADMDHTRGLLAITDTFMVDEFLRSGAPFESGSDSGSQLENMRQKRNIPRRVLFAGDTVELTPTLRLEILHPPSLGRRLSSNNRSLIVRMASLEHGVWRGLALMCGDAQAGALRAAMRFVKNSPQYSSFTPDLQAEALIIPHHGSRTSLLPEFYDMVKPDVALISCSLYNSFGFPAAEVLDALDQRSISAFDTSALGEVQLTWKPGTPPSLISFR